MIAIIIGIILLLLILWLLFSPIELKLDTRSHTYFLHWKSIGQARLKMVPDDLIIQLRILFWKKDFHPLEYKPKKKEKKTKKAKKKKPGKMNFSKWKRKGVRLFKSFTIKSFRLNLDTDNYLYNSYLYPVFYFLNKGKKQWNINYQGEFEFVLIVQNRLYKMLIAMLL